jgi:hypothetical protein
MASLMPRAFARPWRMAIWRFIRVKRNVIGSVIGRPPQRFGFVRSLPARSKDFSMLDSDTQRGGRRRPRFETLEARLLFSAAPAISSPVSAIAKSGSAVNSAAFSYTGLSQVESQYGFTGAGQTVAVIDSGIDYDNVALGGGEGAGYRVVGGWNFAGNNADFYDAGPVGGHGTAVAGVIGSSGATDPGVAPGVDLVGLKVFDGQGNCNFTWVDEALQWVYNNRNAFADPITTVNLSLGTNWNSVTVPQWAILESDFKELESVGIFISVAAGNSFASYDSPGLSYPAASPYVVPVMSVGASGQLSSFSQRASDAIAAPGESILTTVPIYDGTNPNGPDNNSDAFSGTSFAAPYVAGASVLLRQAMQFVGDADISESSIYGILRDTADTIYDPITKSSYLRLNLEAAINSVMQPDSEATALTAHSLGVVNPATAISFSGAISHLADSDYFSFTAGATGVLRLSATTSGNLVAQWRTVGSSGPFPAAAGNLLTMNVVAGQSYTFDLSTAAGLGYYTFGGSLCATNVIDLGVVDYQQWSDSVSGSKTYSFTASQSGTFTALAQCSAAAGNLRLQLVDGAGSVIASSLSVAGGQRLDANVVAGQTYDLQIIGANNNVSMAIENLVSLVGGTLNIHGSVAADAVQITLGNSVQLAIDGISYLFGAGAVNAVNFEGRSGNDNVTITAASGCSTATFHPGTLSMTTGTATTADDMSLSIVAANITVLAVGTDNQATFYDNSGTNTFLETPGSASLQGAGYHNVARGFQTVAADSSGAGDVARLYGGTGANTFTAGISASELVNGQYTTTVNQFKTVQAFAANGAVNNAIFTTSTGNDTFQASGTLAGLSTQQASIWATGFNSVIAIATPQGRHTLSEQTIDFVLEEEGTWS